VVQAIGVELLHRQDMLERGSQMADEYRLAQIAAGADPQEVYAEYFAPVETAEALDEVEFEEADLSGVQWQSPSEMGQDELALLQQFLADDRVDVAEKDLQPGEWF
jgi:hypothetical protein